MNLAVHVTRTGGMENAYTISVGIFEERDYLGDLGIYVNLRLKWILKKK
jgi:hypothetical protein